MDDRNKSRAGAWLRISGVVCLTAAGMFGCQEPLFTPDQSRSQYDRFDAVRDRRAPSYVFDEFGNRRPNIRGRLVVAD
ncbi:MAG: hypothetical protein ACOYN0_13050 [Phycisphaerales bacterium]